MWCGRGGAFCSLFYVSSIYVIFFLLYENIFGLVVHGYKICVCIFIRYLSLRNTVEMSRGKTRG